MNLTDAISPNFYELHNLLKCDSYSEYFLKGGRGSTKSTFVSVEILLGVIRDKNAHAAIFMKYGNLIRNAVLAQFEWSINKLDLNGKFKIYKSPARIEYLQTGQQILFMGLDDAYKTKGLKIPFGYFKYLWFEELDLFSGIEEIRTVTQSAIRGAEKTVTFFTYNPPKSARSWVNSEAKIPKQGRKVHHSTYLDVPPEWLGTQFLENARHLEKTKNQSYQHEYLGLEVGTGSEVFNNITLRPITDAEIAIFDNNLQGIDWGYFPDPFVFERAHYYKRKKILYLYDEISGNRLSNSVAADKIKAKGYHRDLTICDSAEPKSISDMNIYGVKAKGAIKGAGSIETGIKYLAEELNEIVIDPERCPVAAREFINYSLDYNKQGELIHKYPDKDNHSIDTVRYLMEDIIRQNKLILV